jgi:hypothetical protein
MVWGFFVTVKAIGDWCGGFFVLMFLDGEGADAVLWNGAAFLTVLTFAFAPFVCGTLCGMDVGNEVRGRGWGVICKKVVLDPSPSPSMYQVPFD